MLRMSEEDFASQQLSEEEVKKLENHTKLCLKALSGPFGSKHITEGNSNSPKTPKKNFISRPLSLDILEELKETSDMGLKDLATFLSLKATPDNLSPKSPRIGAHAGIKLVPKKALTTVKPFNFATTSKEKNENENSALEPKASTSKTAASTKALAPASNLNSRKSPQDRIPENQRAGPIPVHAGIRFIEKKMPTIAKPFNLTTKPKKKDESTMSAQAGIELLTKKKPTIRRSFSFATKPKENDENQRVEPIKAHAGMKLVVKKMPTTVKPFNLTTKPKKKDPLPDHAGIGLAAKKKSPIRRSFSFSTKPKEKDENQRVQPIQAHAGMKLVAKKMPTTVKPFNLTTKPKKKDASA